MNRALFVTYDAGGNVPPMLGIAQRWQADGGAATVLGDESQRGVIARSALPFEPFTTRQSYRPLARRSLVGMGLDLSGTAASAGIGADAVRLARRDEADVVVVDCMLPGALLAAQRAGLRTVTLVHSLPSFFGGPYAHGPVAWLTALRGVRATRAWAGADATIATVLPGFDLVAPPGVWAGLAVVGPIAAPAAPAPRTGRRRILISLSTVRYAGQDRTLQKLLDAVDGLDAEVVMTTGRSIAPEDLRIPDGVAVHRFVDHDSLLPGLDLVVGHGGHGTTMRALAHDVPLLMIPSFAQADQPGVAAAVVAGGAGRVLGRRAGVPELRRAITELSGPGPHRDAAAVLGARLRALDPAGGAVEHLRRVAEGRMQRRTA